MAKIKPFRALRYNFKKAAAENVCCPPYDVIPDTSAWTQKDPHNAIFLEGGERLNTENPYAEAKAYLDKWLAEGVLFQDETPAFYPYEDVFIARDGKTRTLRGIFALLELSPFSDGVVLPHEFTLSAAKEDRYRLMKATGCQFSPIYGLYDDPGGQIAKALSANDPDALTEAFSSKKIYIADGHHRYETLLRLRDETGLPQYAMVFLAELNDPGVELWETHRVLSSLENYNESALRRRLEERFAVTEGDTADEGTFVWLTGSGSFRLTPKTPITEKSYVAALHNGILEPLLGIDAESMARQKNLTYTRDAGEAANLVRSGAAQCAFLLPPPKLTELRDTVLAGERMPQKSTYFFPKIITGLFMYRFE